MPSRSANPTTTFARRPQVMMTDPAAQAPHRPRQSRRLSRFRSGTNYFRRAETQPGPREGCRTAGIGCIECKSGHGRKFDQVDRAGPPRRKEIERIPSVFGIFSMPAGKRGAGRAADHEPRPRSRLPLEREAQRNHRRAGGLWPRRTLADAVALWARGFSRTIWHIHSWLCSRRLLHRPRGAAKRRLGWAAYARIVGLHPPDGFRAGPRAGSAFCS